MQQRAQPSLSLQIQGLNHLEIQLLAPLCGQLGILHNSNTGVELGSLLLWLLDQTMSVVGGHLQRSWDAQASLFGVS